MLRSLGWALTGFGAAHILESAWHRFTAHGKRPDPTRTGHLEHHRKANERSTCGARCARTQGGSPRPSSSPRVLARYRLKRSVPLSLGLTAGFVAVNFYTHACTFVRRAPLRGMDVALPLAPSRDQRSRELRPDESAPRLRARNGGRPQRGRAAAELRPAWLHEAGGSFAGSASARGPTQQRRPDVQIGAALDRGSDQPGLFAF